MLRHGSLFAGIGGFDLGFARAGIETIWQVENDAYCRRVLKKHFPHARCYDDIRFCCGLRDCGERWKTGGRACTKQHLPWVDILSGGFPCQDISCAGKRAGIADERSGLWREYARIIRELRPRYAVVEDVAALLGPVRRSGRLEEAAPMGRVLGDLAACGYDAEWQSIRAADVGAPHLRERIWIVAYPARGRTQAISEGPGTEGQRAADTDGHREDVSDAAGAGWDGTRPGESGSADRARPFGLAARSDWWAVEPDMGRVAHGVPARVDRLRGLGNAVVPQIAEFIGRQIMRAEHCIEYAEQLGS